MKSRTGQLTIICDGAYAYDYYSILVIKQKNHFTAIEPALLSMQCLLHIIDQIGLTKHQQIMASCEYQALYEANCKVFRLIDQLRDNQPVGVKELDDANLERFKRKQNLQNKFFGGNLQETKTKI